MKQFFGGLLVGAVLVGGAAYWLITRIEAQPIIFPPSRYADSEVSGYLSIRGAVTGTENDRIGEPNNFVSFDCWRDRAECDVIDLQQYRANMVSEPTLEHWRITSWTPQQIVIESRPAGESCYRVLVTVDRRTRHIDYSRQPQMNLARDERCRMMEMRLSRWTISEGVSWREHPPESGLGVPANAQGISQ